VGGGGVGLVTGCTWCGAGERSVLWRGGEWVESRGRQRMRWSWRPRVTRQGCVQHVPWHAPVLYLHASLSPQLVLIVCVVTFHSGTPTLWRCVLHLSCGFLPDCHVCFFFPIPSLSWLILASNLQQGPIPLLRGNRPPRHHLFLSFAQRARCRPSHPQI